MGKFKIDGELDLNSYLTAATTLYISSSTDTSIIFRHGSSEVARINPKGCLNVDSNQSSDTYKLYVNGKANFVDTVTAPTFIGNLTGNADTATQLKIARNFTIGSTAKSFNGTAAVSWTHAEIGATVSNAWTSGATAGPKLITTVNGVASEETTIPTASTGRSGVVTTAAQRFRGAKTLEYPAISSNNGRYQGFYYKNGAGTTVGEHWYDCGDATNIASGQYYWRQHSPNSTANTATTGYYENYYLPTVTIGRTSNVSYEIFTSKSYTTLDNRYVNISGDTMTGVLTLQNSTTTPAKGTIMNIISGKYQNAAGNYYNIGLIDLVASAETSTTVSSGYARFGSHNGTSFFTAGESGRTMPKVLADAGILAAEAAYIIADSSIIMYTGCANDAASYTKAMTVAATKVTSHVPLYGAVWNDYAEYRQQLEDMEPGYCVASTNDGKVYKTTEHLQACDGIVSDTYGFAIGETDDCKTPLAVSGRVLAYCEGNAHDYNAGDTVGASANGKVIKMTREEIKEYPDRIVGIISEIPTYETWGTGNVKVNGRIWVKVR